ncbi:hypothetical protein HanPI659440_Chr13g0510801 [Helianthus annuus]|nr:hypothetical protein HanPI659440_Chr13g0510801 [Helianthus annuus]
MGCNNTNRTTLQLYAHSYDCIRYSVVLISCFFWGIWYKRCWNWKNRCSNLVSFYEQVCFDYVNMVFDCRGLVCFGWLPHITPKSTTKCIIFFLLLYYFTYISFSYDCIISLMYIFFDFNDW